MRIGLYSHSIAPSIDGVCRRFTSIAYELKRQGHDVFLFTLEERPEGIDGIRYYSLGYMYVATYPGKKLGNTSVNNILKIIQVLRLERPDIVHTTADSLSVFFAAPCVALGIPCVTSFHTDLQLLGKALNTSSIAMVATYFKEMVDCRLYDSCATTSESFKAKLLTQRVICEHVINTSVDVDLFNPNKFSLEKRSELTFGHPDGLLCVFVGRLSPEKKIGFMREVLFGIENAYFAIVGDGLEADVWVSLHGPQNRLYCKPAFVSHQQLAEIYASADVHVSASEFETLGNTVLESYSCGTPVVVPKAQGFCDTVRDKVDGFMFTPADMNSAREAVLQFKNNPRLKERMGQVARQRMIEQHTIKAVVDDLLTWYHQGRTKAHNKSVWIKVLLLVGMIANIGLTIFLVAGYQIITGIMSWSGIIPSAKSSRDRQLLAPEQSSIPSPPMRPEAESLRGS